METYSENLKITVYGAGYVGLVTASCFAKLGHQVLCVDIDTSKIERLLNGHVPFFEPGLDELIKDVTSKWNLQFSSDIASGVKFGLYHFIAVGTPPRPDGTADLQYVYSVAKAIAEFREDYCIIINKSTVPVGTADNVKDIITESIKKINKSLSFAVVSNPEFLKEGSAIQDFMQPDRIVVGAQDDHVHVQMRELYKPFIEQGYKFISMDVRSAELTKYAANAMLATRISFMNEVSQIAEHVGANIECVKEGISYDPRIGPYFINPGCGYGGSCFPKDVKALYNTAKQLGYESHLLRAVDEINVRQKQVLFSKIQRHFNQQLSDKVIAVWGLAFKPNTDDIREAPSLELIKALLAAGVTVKAYDPVAMPHVSELFGMQSNLTFCSTAREAIQNADGLAIVTEWSEFREFSLEEIKDFLNHPVIFDGRNIYNARTSEEIGIKYFGIGIGEKL